MDMDDSVQGRRLRAWCAISNLYLDTDISLELDYVVSELLETGFSTAELTHMYEIEVSPAVWTNATFFGAWEWAGFNPEWLEQQIIKQRSHTSKLFQIPILGRFYKFLITSMTRPYWNKVVKRVENPEPMAHTNEK